MSEDTREADTQEVVLVGRRPRTWIWWGLGGVGALGMLAFLIVPRGGSSEGPAASPTASADPGAQSGTVGPALAATVGSAAAGASTSHAGGVARASGAGAAAAPVPEPRRLPDDPNVIGDEDPADPEAAQERAIEAAVAPWKERALYAEKRLARTRGAGSAAQRKAEQRAAELQARVRELEEELGAERRSRIPPPPPPAEQVLQALRPVFGTTQR